MIVDSILNSKGRDVFSVPANMSVRDVVRRLQALNMGATIVLAEDGSLAGIFSERDLMKAVAEQGSTALGLEVGDFMTRQIRTCKPTDGITTIMQIMTNKRIRHLPVLEAGEVIGVISIGDVVKFRIAEAETEAEALKAYIASG
ncbi:MAG: CBS domain-containing protein [Rhodospirillales bacterium]